MGARSGLLAVDVTCAAPPPADRLRLDEAFDVLDVRLLTNRSRVGSAPVFDAASTGAARRREPRCRCP